MFDPHPGSRGSNAEGADEPRPARPGLPLDPGRLARAVRDSRRAVLVAGLVGGLAAGLAARRWVHRSYVSQNALAYEPAPADGPDGAAADEGRTLRTLADTVKLTPNLEAVRERLHRAERIEQIAARIDVESSSETRLLLVRATAESPEDAARLADATGAVFVASRVEVERARLRERARSAADDAAHAREALERAQTSYDSFRSARGITDLPAERLAAVERVARLRAESDAARAEFDAESARQQSLEAAARAQPATAVLSESETRLGAVRGVAAGRVRRPRRLVLGHPDGQRAERVRVAAGPRGARPPRPRVGEDRR